MLLRSLNRPSLVGPYAFLWREDDPLCFGQIGYVEDSPIVSDSFTHARSLAGTEQIRTPLQLRLVLDSKETALAECAERAGWVVLGGRGSREPEVRSASIRGAILVYTSAHRIAGERRTENTSL